MTLYHPDDRYNRLERAAVLALSGHLRDDFSPDDFSLDAYGTDAYDPDGLRPDRGLSGEGRGFVLSFTDPGENIVAPFGDRDTPHISTIHAKINRDGEGEPEYYEHECPAIGISATGQPGEDRKTLKRSLIQINTVIDMVVYGADMGRVDEEIELIASAVQAFIAKSMGMTTPLDGYFCGASAGGYVDSDGVAGVAVRFGKQGGWVGEASTSFTAVVRDEGWRERE